MELHEVEVLHRERFGNHLRLRYRWDGVALDPGRFVVARAGDPSEVPVPFLPRPFFVHDYEHRTASLLFEVRGIGTELLAREGSPLYVSGPLGLGFDVDGVGNGPVVLVGGGVWVAPLKLLARRLEQSDIPYDVYLEAPATAPEGYARLLSESYPSSTLVPTDGFRGTSLKFLEHLGDLARYRAVFASGPSEMLAAVAEVCGGRVTTQVAVRERMACADGSCFGCAVPVADGGYARACVEGPVFEVERLALASEGFVGGVMPR